MQNISIIFKGIFLLSLIILAGCGANSAKVDAQKINAYYDQKYDTMPASGEVIDGVRVIEIKASQFTFDPEVVVVNQGEKIRLIISAEDVPHGFEIEGLELPNFDINDPIKPGEPVTIEFTAKEKGVWEIICSIYCGFGHSGMSGLFVVR